MKRQISVAGHIDPSSESSVAVVEWIEVESDHKRKRDSALRGSTDAGPGFGPHRFMFGGRQPSGDRDYRSDLAVCRLIGLAAGFAASPAKSSIPMTR